MSHLVRGGRLAHTLSRLAAAPALKGEQVGVVAIATQAQVRPPDVIPAVRVEHQLALRQLHHARAQLIAIVVHVDHLAHTHTHRLKDGPRQTHAGDQNCFSYPCCSLFKPLRNKYKHSTCRAKLPNHSH